MPKKEKYNYTVDGRRYPTFNAAAGAAVDSAISSGESVTIVECDEKGRAVGHVNVQASGEPFDS
jgi:hypothetical protein